MDLNTKNPKSATPVKDPHGFQSKLSENSNPNLSHSSPCSKPTNSPLTKSAKSQKSASRNPTLNLNPVIYSPRNKIRERRFVVAKKKSKKGALNSNTTPVDCKCKERYGDNVNKCLCVAYETLRASQEEFFKNKNDVEEKGEADKEKAFDYKAMIEFEEEEIENHFAAQNLEIEDRDGSDTQYSCESEKSGQMGSSTIKRRRDKLLEDARNSAPDSGKVKHLVDAFEKLFTLPNPKESDKTEEEEIKENRKKAMQWALPGLQHPKVVPETEYSSSSFSLPRFQPAEVSETNFSSSSFCPSDFCLTSENLGLDSRISLSSSWDGSQSSNSSRSSNGGRRSRRNSAESSGTMGVRRLKKKKQLKVTSQKPFKLRTEQRGRQKEEEFTKKIQEIMMEEERLRIPVAQGLPWTTDEPECLIKPPVKENTKPVDLKLHSDIRAVERADFDHQVSEKMSLIEQYKMERERQRKLAEEEEIRRLRKELVPKAQPMPYFDRPFIPRRSMKHPTVPREPRFHIPQHKKIKCCLSWSDVSSYTCDQ
ncbi:microtubule-destabilizing protein 60 [Populus nigra]|uniref:microtubule-destabilizing protein 60 n=1 Tax=Populus nigra TaxID=3691 RepID=UPI002B26B374|nr:microtubule-destabilizing protein 60 [Populus nigra]